MPGQQLLEPDLGADDRAADAYLAPLRLFPLGLAAFRVTVVAPSRPRRPGTGQPDRADEEQQGDEQPDQPGPDLAFEQGKGGEPQADQAEADPDDGREALVPAGDHVLDEDRPDAEHEQA